MGLRRLTAHAVPRIWGRRALPGSFAACAPRGEEPIGEIWYEGADGEAPPLLVKYLFTAERLSIQVHPDDEAAQAAGYPVGKDEAWLVLDADPCAVIGLGLREAVTPERLRAAALDGSIEQLIDWRPVKTGDFFYSPAGTVHAIGAGLSLVEIQQPLDLTYRLYDYGRPRELHLDEGIAVARPGPWRAGASPRSLAPGRTILAEGERFVVERCTLDGAMQVEPGDEAVVLIPVEGSVTAGADAIDAGDVAMLTGAVRLEGRADLLLAYAGRDARAGLIRD